MRHTVRNKLAAEFELPASVRAEVGDDAQALFDALHAPSPTSVRLNPAKPIDHAGDQVPWCRHGRYLNERPLFTLDPLLHAGCYYVQEASSMLLEQAMRVTGLQGRDVLALDLCAAPGGKSTHLTSLLSPGSMLVCNEAIPARRAALCENVWKHGAAGTMITGSATKDFAHLGEFFDLILIDAPCSGEGMFRKDPFARQQWNDGLVRSCARVQREILDHAWQALRPGGSLIYSTCTWERSENEDQVKRLLQQDGTIRPLTLDPSWGVIDTEAGHRCYPHRVKGEGFFIAVVQRSGDLPLRKPGPATHDMHDDVSDWINKEHRSQIIEEDNVLFAVPQAWTEVVGELQQYLHAVAPGTPIAERKGTSWKPHAALALSAILDGNAFAQMDLDKERALDYLRGSTVNERGAQGVRLVRHAGHPLGWLFAAGDRWNNGWPKSWRIRMR